MQAVKRVILVADNASSRMGGEAFLPLNYFRLLRARKVDVRLVVHARNRQELSELFPEDSHRLHYVEDTWFHKTLFRLGTLLPRRLAEATTGLLIHLTTQLSQRKVVRNLTRTLQTNVVVHQPIPVSPKAPSLIFGVGAPVIIGPLNGGMEYPPAFQKGILARVGMMFGRGVAEIFNLVIPGKLLAELVLVANQRTRHALPGGTRGRIIEFVDNGVDLTIWERKPETVSPAGRIHLISVGRLIDLKALDIVIEAIHRIRETVDVTLEIVGDGPMRQPWQEMASRLGLSNVTFSGFMSQKECAQRLKQADVSVLSSLIECGGAVVLEAMASGLPVIATAWGGPLDYLDESCGVLVKPASREALIAGFSEGILTLARSPQLRLKMGEAGYERAQHYDWEHKIDQMLKLYEAVSPSIAEPPNRTIR